MRTQISDLACGICGQLGLLLTHRQPVLRGGVHDAVVLSRANAAPVAPCLSVQGLVVLGACLVDVDLILLRLILLLRVLLGTTQLIDPLLNAVVDGGFLLLLCGTEPLVEQVAHTGDVGGDFAGAARRRTRKRGSGSRSASAGLLRLLRLQRLQLLLLLLLLLLFLLQLFAQRGLVGVPRIHRILASSRSHGVLAPHAVGVRAVEPLHGFDLLGGQPAVIIAGGARAGSGLAGRAG